MSKMRDYVISVFLIALLLGTGVFPSELGRDIAKIVKAYSAEMAKP